MIVTVLYFAGLREALDCAQEQIELPPEIQTLGDLRAHIAQRGGTWSALTQMRNVRMARNQAMATADTPLDNGDEIAFFPPVTGG